MKFFTIKEYFYKLNTIGFILLLLPLVTFIFLYFWFLKGTPFVLIPQDAWKIFYIELGVCMLVLTSVHWVLAVKTQGLKKQIELARKMDGYYSVVQIKMSVYCVCSLVMALGFFLTGMIWFTASFLFFSVMLILQWPTPSSFCRRFSLRGGEREMIMKDLLSKK